VICSRTPRIHESCGVSVGFSGLFEATAAMYFKHHGVDAKLEADGSVPSSFEVVTIQGGITNMV
jgi:hypothetical protein